MAPTAQQHGDLLMAVLEYRECCATIARLKRAIGERRRAQMDRYGDYCYMMCDAQDDLDRDEIKKNEYRAANLLVIIKGLPL
jgi:hypothetical protein